MKFFLLFFTFNVWATSGNFSSCGTYELYGRIEKNKKEIGYLFYVNKKTKSEYRFRIPLKESLKIAPYIDMPIRLKARIVKMVKGQNGEIADLEALLRVVPDPLGSKLNRVALKSMEKCIHEK